MKKYNYKLKTVLIKSLMYKIIYKLLYKLKKTLNLNYKIK